MKIIESRNNPRVKEWRKLLTKKGRKDKEQFMIEGEHLAEEAFTSGWPIVDLIVSDTFQIPKSWMENYPMLCQEAYQLPASIFQELTETMTPQGIVMVIKKKPSTSQVERIEQGNFILLLDKIQDPGNLGTIIRTADAAGIDGIVLGKGTVDPFSGKVLRSTQGSIFHLPIYETDLESYIPTLKENDWRLLVTCLQEANDYRQLQIHQNERIALVMGNEGEGVEEKILSMGHEKIKIPIWGKAESLNVAIATGILLYEIQSQYKK